MQDISYTPKLKNRIPQYAMTGSAVCAIAAIVFLMLELGKPVVWQLVFVVSAVAMTYIATRYLAVSFTYTLMAEGLFTVTRRQGRRLTCLCRLELAALYRVRPYTKADDADSRSGSRYNYCVTPAPETSYLLFFDDGEHRASVRLEVEGEFLDRLMLIAQKNLQERQEEEESDEADDA